MSDVNFVILPLANASFDREFIDLAAIRRLSSLGLDSHPPEDRAIAWLCLLGIYPKNPTDWPSSRAEYLESYQGFLIELGVSSWHTRNIPHQPPLDFYGVASSQVMAQIHVDIWRTGHTIFFLPPSPIEGDGYQPDPDDAVMAQFAGHIRRLERILYVFANVNKGWGYMQGFNELVTPFYYVFLKALPIFNNDMLLLEALTFQAFQTLLNETGLHEFYTTQDNSSIIMHRLDDFNRLLCKHMPDVAKKLNELNIHPLTYSFRWFNLLFSQEHELPDVIPIWDDLFAHFENLMDFVFYIALGHISQVTHLLDKANYAMVLSTLQNLPPNIDFKAIVSFANKCWEIDLNKKQKKGFFQKKS